MNQLHRVCVLLLRQRLQKVSVFFCADSCRDHKRCPAKDYKCGWKGHFSMVCQSTQSATSVTTMPRTTLVTIVLTSSELLKRTRVFTLVDDEEAMVLADIGSLGLLISDNYIKRLKLKMDSAIGNASMALSSLNSPIKRLCTVKINLLGKSYPNRSLSVLSDLCDDMILGQDFMSMTYFLLLGALGRAFIFPILLATFDLLQLKCHFYCDDAAGGNNQEKFISLEGSGSNSNQQMPMKKISGGLQTDD